VDNSPNKRKYSGFPSPRDWFSSGARLASWEDLKTSSGSFSDVEPDDLGRALRVVRRAAAIDTGAIEALYEVNRGVTMTIAIESKLWETYLPDKPAVQSLIEAQLQAYERLIVIIKGPGH
jgi:hypothetical protein